MVGFGKFGLANEMASIEDTRDERLIYIDPQQNGFFKNALNNAILNNAIRKRLCRKEIIDFQEAILEIKEVCVSPFFIPKYAPSEGWGRFPVAFKPDRRPIDWLTYNQWVNMVETMPALNGFRHWRIGNQYEYYIYLMYVINRLVMKGVRAERAVANIVCGTNCARDAHISWTGTEYVFTTDDGRKINTGVYDFDMCKRYVECPTNQTSYWVAGENVIPERVINGKRHKELILQGTGPMACLEFKSDKNKMTSGTTCFIVA